MTKTLALRQRLRRAALLVSLLLFPVVLTLSVGLLVPEATPLIATLMLGNLLKVSGVVDRLAKAAQNEIANIATLFLGLTIGSTMSAASFINWDTGKVMLLALLAFVLDTVAGLLFGKLMSALSGGKVNPLIGAAGISAFPMAGRSSARPSALARSTSATVLRVNRVRVRISEKCRPTTRAYQAIMDQRSQEDCPSASRGENRCGAAHQSRYPQVPGHARASRKRSESNCRSLDPRSLGHLWIICPRRGIQWHF